MASNKTRTDNKVSEKIRNNKIFFYMIVHMCYEIEIGCLWRFITVAWAVIVPKRSGFILGLWRFSLEGKGQQPKIRNRTGEDALVPSMSESNHPIVLVSFLVPDF